MKRMGQWGLQCRIAEAVDQCIDMLARLAHGALAGIEAGVIGQVGGVKIEVTGMPRHSVAVAKMALRPATVPP